MRIVLYSNIVRKVSGLFTFEKIFCKTLSKYYDITYVYRDGDQRRIEEMGKYVKTCKEEGQEFEADICVFSSIEHGSPIPRIKAKRYIQIIHTDLKAWKVKHTFPDYITEFISVGKGAARSLKENFSRDSMVIPNMLDKDVRIQKVLRLMTASRIDDGKGFDRMITIAKHLKLSGKPFIWEVYGDGSPTFLNKLKYDLAGITEVIFMGNKPEVQSYMINSDYVVQLSDSEGFCYSIYEALQIGVPVIVTNWEGVSEVVSEGKNGYILEMDLSNLNIDKFYEIPQDVKLETVDSELLWLVLFKK